MCIYIECKLIADFYLFSIKIQDDFVHFPIYVLYIEGHSPKGGGTCDSNDTKASLLKLSFLCLLLLRLFLTSLGSGDDTINQ